MHEHEGLSWVLLNIFLYGYGLQSLLTCISHTLSFSCKTKNFASNVFLPWVLWNHLKLFMACYWTIFYIKNKMYFHGSKQHTIDIQDMCQDLYTARLKSILHKTLIHLKLKSWFCFRSHRTDLFMKEYILSM